MMSDKLLSYAVLADQDPIQASPLEGDSSVLSLTIVVSNDTGQTIDCKSISFGFLKGTNARDLFEDSTGIGLSYPEGWSLKQQDSLFTATPDTASDGKIGGDSVTFVLSGIKVNDQPGTTHMTITQVTADGTATVDYSLEKFPQHFEVSPLTAQPLIVTQGENTTLFWSGTGGATYRLEYLEDVDRKVTINHPKGEPDEPLPSSGSYTIDNLQLTPVMTFNLIVEVHVEGQDDPLRTVRQCIVTVSPPRPEINSFDITANPVEPGQLLSFNLSWDIVGSFQMTANDGEGGMERVLPIPKNATSYTVFPRQLQTIYKLTVFESTKEMMMSMKEDDAPHNAQPTAQTTAVINQMVPVGTIISYAGNAHTFPPGWLVCNGSPFNQDQFPELYAALGNSNVLPNLAGYFLRGLDTTGKVDPDGAGRSILSIQADTFGQHSHVTAQTPWFWNEAIKGDGYIVGTKTTDGLHSQSSTEVGGSETRPKNAAVLYLIFAGLPRQ